MEHSDMTEVSLMKRINTDYNSNKLELINIEKSIPTCWNKIRILFRKTGMYHPPNRIKSAFNSCEFNMGHLIVPSTYLIDRKRIEYRNHSNEKIKFPDLSQPPNPHFPSP